MPLEPLTREELAAELEQRKCRFVKNGPNGYAFWVKPDGEPFSVPPPEQVGAGGKRYPDWFLDDFAKEIGLPPKGAAS